MIHRVIIVMLTKETIEKNINSIEKIRESNPIITLQNKNIYSQFFTYHHHIQSILVSLIRNTTGDVLEPSAGAGFLMQAFSAVDTRKITGWEIDSTLPHISNAPIVYGDFFHLAQETKHYYSTIIGNPPFIQWKNVHTTTQENAQKIKNNYTDKINIYCLFIDACIDLLEDQGELIFITPKEWLYSSSAQPLREKIIRTGVLTDIVDIGEYKVFADADVPSLVIFRFVKTQVQENNILSYYTYPDLTVSYRKIWVKNNHWFIIEKKLLEKCEKWGTLGDFFDIKLGYTTGADTVFDVSDKHDILPRLEKENTVKTIMTSNGMRKYLGFFHNTSFEKIPPYSQSFLLSHKNTLITRKSCSFNERNWFHWGVLRNKSFIESHIPIIFAYNRTRKHPFFFNDNNIQYFTQGILGLYSIIKDHNKKYINEHYTREHDYYHDVVSLLNSTFYKEIFESVGVITGNRITLSPHVLKNIPFPPPSIVKNWKMLRDMLPPSKEVGDFLLNYC